MLRGTKVQPRFPLFTNRSGQRPPFAHHCFLAKCCPSPGEIKVEQADDEQHGEEKDPHKNLTVKTGTGSSENKQVMKAFSHFPCKYKMTPEAFANQSNETIQLAVVKSPEFAHLISFGLLLRPCNLMK